MPPTTYPSFLTFLMRHGWKSAVAALAPWLEWLTNAGLITNYFQPWVGTAASGMAVLALLVSFGAYRRKSDRTRAVGVRIFFTLAVVSLVICLVFKVALGSSITPSSRWLTEFAWIVWVCAYVGLFATVSMLVGVAGLRAMS